MAHRLARTVWKSKATQGTWRAASWTLLALMLFMALAGCVNLPGAATAASAAAVKNNSLRATAKLLERTVLPANSIFEATLEEAGSFGAPANVISTDSRQAAGVSAVNFSIQFSDSQIRPGRRYAVRGRVLVNGQLLFATEQPMAVLASPQDRTVTITLIRPTLPPAPTAARTPSRAPGNTADNAPAPSAARAAEQKSDPQASRKDLQARAQELAAGRAQVGVQAQAQAQAEERAQMRVRAEAQAQATTQSEARALADTKAQAQARADAEARVQSQAKAQADAQAEAQVKAQAEALAAQALAKSQAQAQAKAQAQVAAMPAPAPGALPAPAPTAPAPIPAPAVTAAPAPAPASRTASPESTSRPAGQSAIRRGLYRFAADAATFKDCASGARLPIAQEGANVVLEQAYLRLFSAGDSNPGVLATVAGRVLPRLAPE